MELQERSFYKGQIESRLNSGFLRSPRNGKILNSIILNVFQSPLVISMNLLAAVVSGMLRMVIMPTRAGGS